MSRELRILWVGLSDTGSGRLWGYFENVHDNSWIAAGSFNKYYYTFWGQKGGKIFFGGTRGDNAFKKNVYTKKKNYTEIKDAEFNKAILEEFSMWLLHRKLAKGF